MAKKGVLEHPKTLTLADSLGIMDCFALGILEAFWHHVTDYFEDGDVTNLRPSVFVRSIRYQGDAAQLWSALLDAGFIDQTPEGRLLVHDWPEHCNDYIHTRFYRSLKMFANGTKPKPVSIGKDEKERLSAQWENVDMANLNLTQQLQVQNNSQTVSEQLNNSLPSPTLPSLTLPNLTEEEKQRGASAIEKSDGTLGHNPRPPMTVDIQGHMILLGVSQDRSAEEAEKYASDRKRKGWKIGNTPIADWREDVKMWVQRMPEFARSPGSSPAPKEDPLTPTEIELLEANPDLTAAVRACLSGWQASGLKSAKNSERTVCGYVRHLAARGITAEVLTKYEPKVLSGAKFAPSVYELISLLEPHLQSRGITIAKDEKDDSEQRARNLERYGTESPTFEQIQEYTHGRLHIQREEVGAV
jgi:hypothetical protein